MSIETPWKQDNYVSAVSEPYWYETGGTANIGNGFAALRYRRINSRLDLMFMLKGGSTTVWGSGGWGFSMPFVLPTEAFSASTWSEWTLPARCWDSSASRMWTGVARICSELPPGAIGSQEFPPTAYFLDFFVGTNADRVGATSPFTWAANDVLSACGSIEAFDN